MELPSTHYDLSIIEDKFTTTGKLNSFKKYISSIEPRNIIQIYTGYHSLNELRDFLIKYELYVESKSELIYWVRVYYNSWISSINKRIQVANDYLLIKHIIIEHFTELKQNALKQFITTLDYINNIYIEELINMMPTPSNDEYGDTP
jgi:hypothetical protein